LDKVFYTDEALRDDLFESLNILLSRFIREISERKEERVDGSKLT